VTQRDINSADRSSGEATLSTSTSLVERIKAQEPQAWQRLVDLYAPLVYGWCRVAGLRSEDAGDVVQEVFKSVVTGIDRFRGERRGSFRAWLHSITRNRVNDYFRDRGDELAAEGGTRALEKFQQLAEIDDPTTPTGLPNVDGTVWRRAVMHIQAEFEGQTWKAFWRVVVDGQTPAAVAEELGLSRHSVYQAKSRILRRARQEMDGLEGDI
jgi:RNA polymerase sigma-70 factor (ECF subfamily)